MTHDGLTALMMQIRVDQVHPRGYTFAVAQLCRSQKAITITIINVCILFYSYKSVLSRRLHVPIAATVSLQSIYFSWFPIPIMFFALSYKES